MYLCVSKENKIKEDRMIIKMGGLYLELWKLIPLFPVTSKWVLKRMIASWIKKIVQHCKSTTGVQIRVPKCKFRY